MSEKIVQLNEEIIKSELKELARIVIECMPVSSMRAIRSAGISAIALKHDFTFSGL